jgi:hypothetical protein
MTYLPVVDFIDYMHSHNYDDTNVITFDHIVAGHVIKFACRNDTQPHYYTSLDDEIIFFDSYDAEVDSTLQSSKTLCYGLRVTEFTKADSFVPKLQPQQFALLLAESKSLAWAELKQAGHEKAEQSARRNWRHLQKTRQEVPNNTRDVLNNANNFTVLPNFARNRRF